MADPIVCANFYPEITSGTDNCVTLTISGTGDCTDPIIIDPTTVISPQEGNSVQCLADGLYAAAETLCYRISFSQSGDLCVTDPTCVTYERITAGSVVALRDPYVNTPPLGGPITISLVNSTGAVLATATIAAGSNSGTWSQSQITFAGEAFVGIRIDTVGTAATGCSLSQDFLACEPTSLFAPAADAVNNLQSVDIITDGTITSTPSGTGTSLDPLTFTLAQRIDADATNRIEVRPGGLYVAPGASITAGDRITVTGTGSVATPYVITGQATTLSTDACNELQYRSGALYSPANPTDIVTTSTAQGTVSVNGLAPNLNQAYQQTPIIAVTNNDPCGRSQRVDIDFFWGGVQARLSATTLNTDGTIATFADQLLVSAEWVTNTTSSSIGQVILNGSQGMRFDRTASTSFSFNNTFILAPGATRNITCRYRVVGISGVPTIESFFANGFRINQKAIV